MQLADADRFLGKYLQKNKHINSGFFSDKFEQQKNLAHFRLWKCS